MRQQRNWSQCKLGWNETIQIEIEISLCQNFHNYSVLVCMFMTKHTGIITKTGSLYFTMCTFSKKRLHFNLGEYWKVSQYVTPSPLIKWAIEMNYSHILRLNWVTFYLYCVTVSHMPKALDTSLTHNASDWSGCFRGSNCCPTLLSYAYMSSNIGTLYLPICRPVCEIYLRNH